VTDTSVAERYLRLGLRVGRHVDGIVDAYFGPPELAAEVEAESLVVPRELADHADALLGELDDGWLRDQVEGLRTYAGVLAGDQTPYADEVEGCYGVRPAWTDEAVFAAAHEELEQLLPGEGTLAERLDRWETSIRVPAEQVEDAVAAVIDETRVWARRLVDLPDGEGVVVEIVRDEPWIAFCAYLGNFRSRIAVNVDLPISAIELLVLAIHETYPGHHVERCCKDQLLVRGAGLLEETIVLVPTPQAVVAEGIATVAPWVLLEGDAGPALVSIVSEAGIELDLDHALTVGRALEPCRRSSVNAALMLHERGASEAETQSYIERWGLLTSVQAAHAIRFFTEPTSRSYVLTYSAGRDLCRSYIACDPERFRRLLTEQIRVRDLVVSQDAAARAA
jgi:hypothetical protein